MLINCIPRHQLYYLGLKSVHGIRSVTEASGYELPISTELVPTKTRQTKTRPQQMEHKSQSHLQLQRGSRNVWTSRSLVVTVIIGRLSRQVSVKLYRTASRDMHPDPSQHSPIISSMIILNRNVYRGHFFKHHWSFRMNLIIHRLPIFDHGCGSRMSTGYWLTSGAYPSTEEYWIKLSGLLNRTRVLNWENLRFWGRRWAQRVARKRRGIKIRPMQPRPERNSVCCSRMSFLWSGLKRLGIIAVKTLATAGIKLILLWLT